MSYKTHKRAPPTPAELQRIKTAFDAGVPRGELVKRFGLAMITIYRLLGRKRPKAKGVVNR